MNTFIKTSILVAALAIPSFAQAQTITYYDPSHDPNQSAFKTITVQPNPATRAAVAADVARFQPAGSILLGTHGDSGVTTHVIYDPSSDTGHAAWETITVPNTTADSAAAAADVTRIKALFANGPVTTVYDPSHDSGKPAFIPELSAG